MNTEALGSIVSLLRWRAHYAHTVWGYGLNDVVGDGLNPGKFILLVELSKSSACGFLLTSIAEKDTANMTAWDIENNAG